MKVIPKKTIAKINSINLLLNEVNESGNYASTYAGGTYAHYVILDKPIEIKKQFVYIYWNKNKYNFDNVYERFNTNKRGYFDDGGLLTLDYTLNIIFKAFVKLIKEERKENGNDY